MRRRRGPKLHWRAKSGAVCDSFAAFSLASQSKP